MQDIQWFTAGGGGGGGTSFWTANGDDIYNNNSGNVGIGTSSPLAKLGIIGKIALNDGNDNVAIGDSALTNVTTGTQGVAIGHQALANNATGGRNVVIGFQAEQFRNGAFDNVTIGHQAHKNTGSFGGQRVVAIGAQALSNNYGPNNVAIGYRAFQAFGQGSDSVAIGFAAGENVNGGSNVLIGSFAGNGVSGSSTFADTIAIGRLALRNLTSGSGNAAIGSSAGFGITSGGFNLSFGFQSNYEVTTGSYNTAIGWQANRFVGSASSDNTGVGYLANSRSTGLGNTALGSRAAEGVIGGSSFNYATAIGARSLEELTTGSSNTALGYMAGSSLTEGSGNVLLGFMAGSNLTGERDLLYIANSDTPNPLIYGEFVNRLARVNGRLDVVGVGSTSSTSAFLATNSVGSTILAAKDDGNVGIGTTSPAERLHVDGGNLRVNGEATIGQQFFASGNTPARIYLGTGNSSLTYLLSGRSMLQIRLSTTSASNSGSAAATFNVMRATGATFAAAGTELGSDNLSLYYATNPDDSYIGAIRRQAAGWFATNKHILIGIADSDYNNASAGTALWYTNNQVRSRGLLLSNTGNVGIGTVSPAYKLDVNGSINAENSIFPVLSFARTTSITGGSFGSTSGIASAMRLTTTTSGSMTDGFGGGIVFNLNDNGLSTDNYVARFYARRDGADNVGALEFFVGTTGLTSGMIIRGSGNVGIGTSTPASRLQVDGEVMVGGGTTTGPVKLKIVGTGKRGGSIRAYADGTGSGGLVYDSNEGLGGSHFFSGAVQPFQNLSHNLGSEGWVWNTLYVQTIRARNNASHGNLTIRSGTTSNYIRLQIQDTEYVRLANTGNFGIGTTTPQERLSVVGRIALTDGNGNVAVGNDANTQTTGQSNTAIGFGALRGGGGATFSRNTGIGYEALAVLQDGNGQPFGNVAIGYQAANLLTRGYGNIAIGERAQVGTTGDGTIAIGHAVVSTGVTIGFAANGTGGLAIGRVAIASATGSHAIGTGTQATSNENQAFGNGCIATGAASIAYGYRCTASGGRTIAIGNQITASGNDSIGIGSVTNITGIYAVGVGRLTRANNDCISIGYETGRHTTGVNNVLIGTQAGRGVAGSSTFANSIGIGKNALIGLTTGGFNIAIGTQSGQTITTGEKNVLIGYQAGATLTTESNRLFIENSNSTAPLIYGEFDNDFVRINGSFEVTEAVSYAITDVTHSAASEYLVGSTEFIVFNTWSGANGQAFVRLPLVANSEGRVLRFKSDGTINNSAYATITPNAADVGVTIDGLASFDLDRDYDGIMLLCHNSNWYVIQRKSK